MPVALYQLLRDRGIECLEASEKEFRGSGGLSVSVLALGPRRCVTLAGFPRTLRTMKDAGCEVTCFMADALCLPCETMNERLSLMEERLDFTERLIGRGGMGGRAGSEDQ